MNDLTPQKTLARWKRFKRFAGVLTFLSITISLPIAVYQMWKEDQRQIETLQDKTYDEMDLRYIEFLKLSLQYPKLDVRDVPDPSPQPLSEEERIQQKILYTIVISMLERTFLIFQKNLPSRHHQWDGWDQYADNFVSREAFRQVWAEVGNEFDLRFQDYMNEKVKKHASPAPGPGAAPQR